MCTGEYQQRRKRMVHGGDKKQQKQRLAKCSLYVPAPRSHLVICGHIVLCGMEDVLEQSREDLPCNETMGIDWLID